MSGAKGQGSGKVGGGLQVMWGVAGHSKDFSLYSECAEELLGFEQSGHVTALDFKGSPWLVCGEQTAGARVAAGAWSED